MKQCIYTSKVYLLIAHSKLLLFSDCTKEERLVKMKKCETNFVSFCSFSLDDSGAVHPGISAKPPSKAGMCYCVPGGDLRLAKALSLFLHPPPPRHHDRQPSLDHMDSKGHELHRGEHFNDSHCFSLSLK